MDSALTTIGLPIALAIIMFGLGLDLTSTTSAASDGTREPSRWRWPAS